MDEIIESTVNAEPVVNVEPLINEQATGPTNETVNADNVETTTTQVEDKQVQSKEKNAEYANIRREYEAKIAIESQKAIDAEYDRLYGESHGIHNKADYDNAVKAQEEQSKVDEYVQNNIPEEYARELVESKKFREQFESERQTQIQKEYTNKQYSEFSEAYPDVKGEEITQEVWKAFNEGMPLKVAYAVHQENASLKAKLAEYEKGSKTQEINIKNALTSTGSTVGNGITSNDFIAKEVFEANKGNHDWMSKNYDLLTNSMNKWK